MIFPDYRKDNILNLMSSILNVYNYRSGYKPLKILEQYSLKKANNIIFFLIDGLGFDYINRHDNHEILYEKRIGKLLTVFPSTTASAFTSIFTGLAPNEHNITGWFVFLKEYGTVSAILPFASRYSKKTFADDIQIETVFHKNDSIFKKIKYCQKHFICNEYLSKDKTVELQVHNGEIHSYKTLNDITSSIVKIVSKNNLKKFIFIYYDKFDGIAHKHGVNSQRASKEYSKINKMFTRLSGEIANTSSKIIMTSDHGFLDTTANHFINLNEHPKLYDTLSIPLCGDSRVKYCYVKPDKVEVFKDYVSKKFGNKCYLYSKDEILDKSFFGPKKNNNKTLEDRIGDYILILRDRYIMKDFLENEEEEFFQGNHSGLSPDEMYVPLIVI